MKLVCFLVLAVFTLSAHAQDEQQPGLMRRTLRTSIDAVKKPFSSFRRSAPPSARGLQLEMKLNPDQVNLSETRQIQATLLLTNVSKKLVQLEFPTTQRIEVVVRNSQGKAVVQWSEDETFTSDPGFVAINPGEHVEYVASLPTRELAAGKLYTIEGFFPKYPELRTHRLVTPSK